jgi:hypothetical protein
VSETIRRDGRLPLVADAIAQPLLGGEVGSRLGGSGGEQQACQKDTKIKSGVCPETQTHPPGPQGGAGRTAGAAAASFKLYQCWTRIYTEKQPVVGISRPEWEEKLLNSNGRGTGTAFKQPEAHHCRATAATMRARASTSRVSTTSPGECEYRSGQPRATSVDP